MLHQVARPSSTLSVAEQYVHYLVNIKGPSSTTSTWQRNNDVAGIHSTGTPMWTRSRHGNTPIQLDFPEIWHNTPGQYIECTCKLTANRTIMTNNIMTFNQVKCKHQHATHEVKPNLCIESLRLSLTNRLPHNRTVITTDHEWNHTWFNWFPCNQQWSLSDHKWYHNSQSRWPHHNPTSAMQIT